MTPYHIEELCQILGKIAIDTESLEPFEIDYRNDYGNTKILPGF